MRVFPLFSPEDQDLEKKKWWADGWGYAGRKDDVCQEGGEWKRVYTSAHRRVLARVLDRRLGTKEVCDHINGKRLDNRRENLRLTDAKGNAENRVGYGKWGKGVKKNSKCRTRPFEAVVISGGISFHLGMHKTPEEAAEAAQKKRQELGLLGRV